MNAESEEYLVELLGHRPAPWMLRAAHIRNAHQEERPMNSCNHEGCTAQSESHHWGKKKAQSAGWFFQRGGVSWCPEHVPDWVGPWRAKQAGKGVRGQGAQVLLLDEPNDIWDAFSGGAAPDVSTEDYWHPTTPDPKERHDDAR